MDRSGYVRIRELMPPVASAAAIATPAMAAAIAVMAEIRAKGAAWCKFAAV